MTIEIDTMTFASDPRVYPYFDSFEQMEHLFSHSMEFRVFANEPGSFLYPNDHLELLIDVISQPANYCGLTNKSDCLERHNVKVAAEFGNEVPYAEIRIGELKRYGVIVKYPLNEVKNQSRIASKMESIYGN
ncbi:MAG: hypothetical protein ABW152_02685 [Candidatus Thiodiazotropha endolucinida]